MHIHINSYKILQSKLSINTIEIVSEKAGIVGIQFLLLHFTSLSTKELNWIELNTADVMK